MARLPDVTGLGPRPIPSAARPIMDNSGPGRGVAQAANIMTDDANRSASGVMALSKGVSDVSAVMAAVQARDDEQHNAVERARTVSDYSDYLRTQLDKRRTEGDFSRLDDLTAFGEEARQAEAKFVAEHPGSPRSKAALLERLIGIRSQFQGQAVAANVAARDAVVTGALDKSLSRITASVLANPSGLADALRSWDSEVDNYGAAISPEKQIQHLALGRQTAVVAAAESFLQRGNAKAARALLAEPGILEMISPEKQVQLNQQFATIEQKAVEGQVQARVILDKARAILGREPTTAERVKLAGVDVAAGGKTAADQIAEIVAVLGPLTPEQIQRKLGVLGNTAQLSDIASIRREFTDQSKVFIQTRDAFQRLASVEASPAGDIARVFSFMRMLDPTSTVREGEFATAKNAGGIPERVKAAYNNALEGQFLTPNMRQDFTRQAKQLFDAQLSNQRQLEVSYKALATRNGLDPNDVALDYVGKSPELKLPEPPKVGDVLQGYRYKGGNPAAEASWERVQ